MAVDIPSSARGLIFDCDGTLADTMPLHWEAWHSALATFGLRFEQGFLSPYAGVPLEVIIRDLNARFDCSLDPLVFSEVCGKFLHEKLPFAAPIEPVVSVVRAYHGRLPMAVVSGGLRRDVEVTLNSLGLRECFAAVITADDPVAPKPSPDIFLEAARRLNVPAKACHVFEDAEAGIAGARAAGMTVTDVRGLGVQVLAAERLECREDNCDRP